jgi:hypothetical protein
VGSTGQKREFNEALGFHSISFPNEWGVREYFGIKKPDIVSIQLVSPASGEKKKEPRNYILPIRFHSISFPNEWGA